MGAAADVAGAELVVQATPVGMGAGGRRSAPALPVRPGALHAGQVVADLVYHPPVTPLLAAAPRRGAPTVGGLGMLVHQAALAIEHWTGRPRPVEAMWAAAEAALGTGQ